MSVTGYASIFLSDRLSLAMKKILFLSALALSLCVLNANAATLVEIQHRKGPSRIYTDKAKGRMDLPGKDQYLIIDRDQKQLYLVKPSKQEVLDLSFFMGQLGAPSNGQGKGTALVHKGPGPTIAGYETERFDYAPANVLCGSALVSKAALKDAGMESLFALLQEAASKLHTFSQLFKAKKNDPCQDAEQLVAVDIAGLGLPMRILDKEGVPWSEVTAIKKDAELPADAFVYPKSYKVKGFVRIRERINETIQQHLPQINQLLEQLKKPGGAASATGGQ
jgi:hypothetical protein